MTSLISCKFHQFSIVKLKFAHNFSNIFLDSKLELLYLGLRVYVNLFPNSQKYWKLGFNFALVGLHNFSSYKSDGIMGFLNVGLGCTSKFLPIHWRVGKLIFLSSTYLCRRVNLWLDCQFLREKMFPNIYARNLC